MAQPQQYAGLGGQPPAPGAEGTDSYRETFRAEPFDAPLVLVESPLLKLSSPVGK